MLNTQKTTSIEIAVRLYENEKYGTTHGKGLYRKAIFNGSIDTINPQVKYVIDLYNYDDWTNQASTDGQMDVVRLFPVKDDKIYSWIQRYDTSTKVKTLVDGFCSLDLKSSDMLVVICDTESDVTDTWKLAAKPCRQALGRKAPQLLATNAIQLGTAQQSAPVQTSTATLQQRMQALYVWNAYGRSLTKGNTLQRVLHKVHWLSAKYKRQRLVALSLAFD